jgi:hypothetical protein
VAGARTGGGTGFGQFARDDDGYIAGRADRVQPSRSRASRDHRGIGNMVDRKIAPTSNGWGLISVPAGVGSAGTCPASACGTATPAFFVAAVSQQGARGVPTIHSELKSQSIELNDVIKFNDWSFNVGVLFSEDTLYGQGLAKADNVAGFVASGHEVRDASSVSAT